MVKAKVLSLHVTCPNCEYSQLVDASEFNKEKLDAFTEYSTECDDCDREFWFQLDVFE